MSSDLAIRVTDLSKCYHVYNRPRDRLKQALAFGRAKYYRDFWALRDISFSVKQGETVGVIGRNGSGKSSLLQLICSTLTPTTGTIEVNGRIGALLELAAGFSSEFTGRENAYINAAIMGLRPEEIDERFDDIVEFSGIGDYIDQPVKTYSSGMYVRLAFSVIAHIDADILVVDEALSVGDIFFTQKCMRFMRDFREHGTIFFVSHDISAVSSLCHRVLWIDRGVLRMQGPTKDVVDAYIASQYEGHEEVGDIDRRENAVAGERKAARFRQRGPVHDPRTELINNSKYRNDIEILELNPDSAEFGQGGAHIEHVMLVDESNRQLGAIIGGEVVNLIVECRANQDLHSPIIGFYLRDRLGQTLFGDNTYLTHVDNPVRIDAGQRFRGRFRFQMPILAPGDYTITVSIAEGSQAVNIQHHWIHDALALRSVTSRVASGIVGVPMLDVGIEPLQGEAEEQT